MSTQTLTGVHWSRRGACRDEDPDLCFPEGRGYALEAAVMQALRVCGRCPSDVRAKCLAAVLAERPSQRNVGKVAGGRYFPRPKPKPAKEVMPS